jgi:hypothetical protein
VVLHAKVDSIEGRKMYMTASVEDVKTNKLLVESTTLFVFMKKLWWDPFNLLPKIQQFF